MIEQPLVEDQARHPACRSEQVGRAIPSSEHAISVTLPTIDSVVGYEEGLPAVVEAMECGYPRFVIHPLIEEVVASFKEAYPEHAASYVLPFPSADAALEAAQFVSADGRFLNDTVRLIEGVSVTEFASAVSDQKLYMLAAPEAARAAARSFWQHTGRIVTSRQAADFLHSAVSPFTASELDSAIRQELARVAGARPESIRLYPTGMAAIYDAFQLVNILHTDSPLERTGTVQFGFPYVDTEKIQQKSENGYTLLGKGDAADIEALRALVEAGRVSAVFTEVPGNPLLQTPDLKTISELLRPAGIPLIVDETLGTFYNVDVSEFADITVSSLSKYYTGSATVMAGGLIVNERSPLAEELLELLEAGYETECHVSDLHVLHERGGVGFEDRMQVINENAERLAEFLDEHPLVARVYYPSLVDSKSSFDVLKKEQGGYGGLLSIELTSPEVTEAFFDALQVSKGPSLGAEFTLACPYTLLAHYNELDRVGAEGVSRDLIRISVGSLESPADLIATFKRALDGASTVLP